MVLFARALSLRSSDAPRVRGLEPAPQLGAAVMNTIDVRAKRRLSDVIRITDFTRGWRIALPLIARRISAHALRLRATAGGESTGLYGYRGTTWSATRPLDLATRHQRPVYPFCLQLGHRRFASDVVKPAPIKIPVRKMPNITRDPVPICDVGEGPGRLNGSEFAALTPTARHVSHRSIAPHVHADQHRCDLRAPRLSAAFLHFDPQRPVSVDELLRSAQ